MVYHLMTFVKVLLMNVSDFLCLVRKQPYQPTFRSSMITDIVRTQRSRENGN